MARQIGDLEKAALDLIRSRNGSILQSDLWKELGLDSREGSRLVIRLVKKGLVKRETVSINGRKTYRLFAVEQTAKTAPSLAVDLKTAMDVPCTTCPYIAQCGPGNFYDPATCAWLDSWLEKKTGRLRLRTPQKAF
ncbi:MAG: Lrp/AsnC family transcriptional regulator [Desulfurococcales archaeon]|nr:Lrp/AsnC family transcriptional regulator [Desulfurococcales archaeon]